MLTENNIDIVIHNVSFFSMNGDPLRKKSDTSPITVRITVCVFIETMSTINYYCVTPWKH